MVNVLFAIVLHEVYESVRILWRIQSHDVFWTNDFEPANEIDAEVAQTILKSMTWVGKVPLLARTYDLILKPSQNICGIFIAA
jgi:hypothetical protein